MKREQFILDDSSYKSVTAFINLNVPSNMARPETLVKCKYGSRASYIQPVLSGKRKLGASRETESTQETADKGKVVTQNQI